jgi:signal transduction histidine kinase
MTALRLQLELLYTQCESYPAAQGQIAKAQDLVHAVDRDLDELVARLPGGAGLQRLRSCFFKLGRANVSAIRIAAECAVFRGAARALSREVTANLYAITQEALHNIVKHACDIGICSTQALWRLRRPID